MYIYKNNSKNYFSITSKVSNIIPFSQPMDRMEQRTIQVGETNLKYTYCTHILYCHVQIKWMDFTSLFWPLCRVRQSLPDFNNYAYYVLYFDVPLVQYIKVGGSEYVLWSCNMVHCSFLFPGPLILHENQVFFTLCNLVLLLMNVYEWHRFCLQKVPENWDLQISPPNYSLKIVYSHRITNGMYHAKQIKL